MTKEKSNKPPIKGLQKLLIVESPAKIKTISKFLSKDFKIMSTMGHIKDLPSKEVGITINGAIDLTYVPIEGKERTIADICRQASRSSELFLAPDPDREGEIIAWHVNQEVQKVLKKGSLVHRIAFNEITAPAVREAIENPSSIDKQKVAAQQARRVLDRWVGYEVSPILWKRLSPGLSAGRVQSVALRLVCDREEAIQAFKPEEYWSIEGSFKHKRNSFFAMLTHIGTKKAEIKNKKTADKAKSEIEKENFVIDSIQDKKRNKNPLPPFMTSTLQQAAYNRLGFSVKKTMTAAQKLYEGVPLGDPQNPVALITYMRTDSLRLSETAIKQARSFIKSQYDKEYLPSSANVYAKKSKAKAQDAHEAIRPIDMNVTPLEAKKHLPKDLGRLYELIWQRCLASQMSPALYAQRQVVLKGGKYTFKVTGSTLIFDGFLRVYGVEEDEKEKKAKIPASITPKEAVDITKVDPKQHFTQPPPRYTEASLVKEMEKEGIGRPSTYSATLNTIQARSYTALDERKRFVPTELGMAVTKLLVENLPKIMETKFTANMEEKLDEIANGDLGRDELLRKFYDAFQKDLEAFRGSSKDVKREIIKTDLKCPKCKETLAIRFGKSGEFIGCIGYPECSFTSNFERLEDGSIKMIETEKPVLLEEKCPKCGEQMREIRGRFGPFVACSGYPKCKHIKQNIAKFACPQDQGQVVERAWRGGKFWGCSNYPTCKFAIFDQVEEKPCPKCKWPIMAAKVKKDKEKVVYCVNKECNPILKEKAAKAKKK